MGNEGMGSCLKTFDVHFLELHFVIFPFSMIAAPVIGARV
jgi:hypothetical protein